MRGGYVTDTPVRRGLVLSKQYFYPGLDNYIDRKGKWKGAMGEEGGMGKQR